MPNPQPFLPETETKVPIVHAPGGGKVVGVLDAKSYFKVQSAETGGAYAVLEQEIPAGHGPPLHVHRHETEIFYVLEGEFEITLGDEKIIATPGAIAVGPRDIPHTFRNIGARMGRLLLTVIPGRFSEFFVEVDQFPNPDLATLKSLCAKYDVDIFDS
ncbi:MAG TPA: cupin domain-containing protein [Pirellulales bacterium]|jgi:quercetin dioxygenase-like cupin family protein